MTSPARLTLRPEETVAKRPRKWPVIGAVLVLLAFYAGMSMAAARHKGLSYDEGVHIAIGYDMWLRRDFRMEMADGDLVKRWATLPLLISRPQFPAPNDPYWRAGGPYEVAFQFFFTQGNDPRVLLSECRAMIVLVGLATGLLVFFCSRELFGTTGALISLTLFVSSPSMLAFGGIVCTEMTTFFSLLGCAWSSWRLLHRVTLWRLLASLGFSGLLVLAKPTAVIMLPLAVIMVAVRIAVGRPLEWRFIRDRVIHSRSAKAGIFGGLLLLHVAVGWATIWAAYDFRYAASPNPSDPGIGFRTQPEAPIAPHIASFIGWSRRTHTFPQGFLRGIEWILAQNGYQVAFMDGQWKFGGWRVFFPYAIWVKTQPAFFALIGLSLLGWRWRKRPSSLSSAPSGLASAGELLYQSIPFIGLIVAYLGTAIAWNLNIGFRHILPIYPPAYVLAGALAFVWSMRGLIAKSAIALLLAWHVSGPIEIYPHYLAYFSPVAGGPTEGYKHLVDSSLDWGMDLPSFKQWLDVHNPDQREPVFFSYFGVGNPDYYHIKSFRLPGRPDWRSGPSYPLAPGIYAISATLLQGMGTVIVGPWNKAFEKAYWRSLSLINEYDKTLNDPKAHAALMAKYPAATWNAEYEQFEILRFGRLIAWLRHHRPPDDNVGYSILIWHLTKEEIFDIGLGPPAELADAPLHR